MITIRQRLVSSTKYAIKCPNQMTPIGICVHNTANDASADGEIGYMIGNDKQTSFHFAVDDFEAVQGLPLDRNGWHAGDGQGEGNRKHIGIEICYSKSGGDRFTKAEKNAIELIAQLLKERGWGVDRVKKHQDFSGKYCPHRTLDLGWDRFINEVQLKLKGTGNMSDKIYTEAEMTKVRLERDSNWTKYQQEIQAHKLTALQLMDTKDKLKACENKPVVTPVPGQPPIVEGWKVNGLQVRDGDKLWNYQKEAK